MQAAAFRRDASGESVVQARSALLPTLDGSGTMTQGNQETSVSGFGTISDTDIDTESYARRVRATVSVATPHRGAPIATFFTGLLGGSSVVRGLPS